MEKLATLATLPNNKNTKTLTTEHFLPFGHSHPEVKVAKVANRQGVATLNWCEGSKNFAFLDPDFLTRRLGRAKSMKSDEAGAQFRRFERNSYPLVSLQRLGFPHNFKACRNRVGRKPPAAAISPPISRSIAGRAKQE
jgi:hypothetical protein